MKNYVQTIDGKVLRGPVRVRRSRSLRGLGDGLSVDDSGIPIDNSLPYLQDSTPLFSGATPPFTPSGSSGSSELNTILNTAAGTLSKIFTAQFAVPPPGTMITTPQGTIYRAQTGTTLSLPSSLANFGSSGILPWLLIGGVGLVIVASMFKGRK